MPLPPVSRPITTIDLFKTAAVILMVIDHLGFHFFVESLSPITEGDPNLWFRVIGRACVPIWFFLIGYANTRAIGWPLVIGAAVLVVANLVTGMFVFPLNVLFSMMFIRLILNPVARLAFGSFEGLIAVLGLSLIFLYPSVFWTEYGTLGLLIALMGYAVRHGDQKTGLFAYTRFRPIFLWGIVAIMAVSQLQIFTNFSAFQFWVMAAGLACVSALLFHVPFTTYPDLTKRLPPLITHIIQFMGRRTLEIYVVHLTLFKIIALVFGLGYPIYGWFDWHWTIEESFLAGFNRIS